MGRLGRLVLAQLPHLCARDVTLALDAFARLGAKPCGQGLRPPRGLLAGLGARAARLAGELEAAQLPLVLWALGALRAEVAMGPLSAAVTRHAPDLSAQVRFVIGPQTLWRRLLFETYISSRRSVVTVDAFAHVQSWGRSAAAILMHDVLAIYTRNLGVYLSCI